MKVIKSFSIDSEIIKEFNDLIAERKFSDVISFLIEKYVNDNKVSNVSSLNVTSLSDRINLLEQEKERLEQEKRAIVEKEENEKKELLERQEIERLNRLKQEEEIKKYQELIEQKKKEEIETKLRKYLNEQQIIEFKEKYGDNATNENILNFRVDLISRIREENGK